MKAKVINDLETRIRKERKRIATENCRRWLLYYYDVTGKRLAAPILTPREIKATKLPSTNNEQKAITISLW